MNVEDRYVMLVDENGQPLKASEKEIFDKEFPFWANFFRDRKAGETR